MSLIETYAHRHPSVVEKLQWLDPNPNLTGKAKDVAMLFAQAARHLLDVVTEDGPQLTLGLQHLIEAKDAIVRATKPNRNPA